MCLLLTVVVKKPDLVLTMTPDMIDFSDEEGYGKFLDLHEVYDMYLNLKQMEVGIKIASGIYYY